MNICLIPARGGSKRIPKKNSKLFAGAPIITYPIRAARASGLFSRIIVSTDSEEIAAIAREAGAEVPFMRPENISGDHTTTAEVLLHGLEWLRAQGENPEYLCCIYPTAPFLDPVYLKRGLELLKTKGGGGAFSVTTFPFPPFRAHRLNREGRLEMLWPEHELTRSNDLPEAYHDAGQFYWLKVQNFLQEKKVWPKDAWPIVLPRQWVQDIDTPEDWQVAELMYQRYIVQHPRN